MSTGWLEENKGGRVTVSFKQTRVFIIIYRLLFRGCVGGEVFVLSDSQQTFQGGFHSCELVLKGETRELGKKEK